MARIFADRTEAGRLLAQIIAEKNYIDPVILALPRGGVPIAFEVARTLGAPMDLILVRKIGTPGQPELALGAVVDGQIPQCVVNEDVMKRAGVSEPELERAKQRQIEEIARRRALYLGGRDRLSATGKTAIVIDDGIATGATARVALRALRKAGPAKLVLAVPVAPVETLKSLGDEADEILCLQSPEPFYAVGFFYRDFEPVSDQDVSSMLANHKDRRRG